jgi:hypothetical protein
VGSFPQIRDLLEDEDWKESGCSQSGEVEREIEQTVMQQDWSQSRESEV